jgi:predicted HAD superfamily phosphohydrolase YqeG
MWYAEDLALIAENEQELLQKLKRWKDAMEEKGLRVNVAKTNCCST